MADEDLNILNDLVAKALRAGADAADALLANSTDMSVSVRLGKVEDVERSESGDLGLRVFIGKKQAVVSSTDRSPSSLEALVERAVSMARAVPEDPFCGIADKSEISLSFPDVESADTKEFSAEELLDMARATEEAALAVKGVTNSSGAHAGYGSGNMALVASNGFVGRRHSTGYSVGVSVIAGEGTGMEVDHDGASRVFASDLPSCQFIGNRAGERATAKLNPRKMPTTNAPVFFDPRVSGELIGAFLSAISGSSVARGTSFLKDKMNLPVFSKGITIVDDPLRPRGLRSKPFDAEGVLPHMRNLIDNGVLTTWILDLRSSRQLGLKSTGHASRSAGGMPHPSPSNVYVKAGESSVATLMQDVTQGFYVTDTMGMGINGVTGDYSQAASGFWIENGKISFPVSEMSIAGNLKDMFAHMSAADDLEFERGINTPTLRIDGMTIAGT